MKNHEAVIAGIIHAHTRAEKDALIAHLQAKLRLAEEALKIVDYTNRSRG